MQLPSFVCAVLIKLSWDLRNASASTQIRHADKLTAPRADPSLNPEHSARRATSVPALGQECTSARAAWQWRPPSTLGVGAQFTALADAANAEIGLSLKASCQNRIEFEDVRIRVERSETRDPSFSASERIPRWLLRLPPRQHGCPTPRQRRPQYAHNLARSIRRSTGEPGRRAFDLEWRTARRAGLTRKAAQERRAGQGRLPNRLRLRPELCGTAAAASLAAARNHYKNPPHFGFRTSPVIERPRRADRSPYRKRGRGRRRAPDESAGRR